MCICFKLRTLLNVKISYVAILWQPIPLIKLCSEACSLTFTHPLGKELIAVGILSISAYHAPSLLTEPPHDTKDADTSPLIFGLIGVITIWLNSSTLTKRASFTKVTTWEV